MEHSYSVQRLRIQNFKGISQAEVQFDDSLTLLIGANGVGKTSVLQALLASLCAIWQTSSHYGHILFPLPEDAVHQNTRFSKIHMEIGDPARNTWGFQFHINSDQDVVRPDEPGSLHAFTDNIHPDYFLPLLVYFAQDRGSAGNTSFMSEPFASVTAKSNRLTSLETSESSLREFTSWFFEKEAIEGQEMRERSDASYQDSELEIIRNLLEHLEHFSAIRSRKNYFLITKNHIDLTFESLSSGERVFILLVLDLARRLMLANPDRKLSELRGIVCIDEIELHLHPAWQRTILPTLTGMFPSCQFIITTHSPQVTGSVESKHVRMLKIDSNGHVDVAQPIATKGRDTNYLLEGVFDTTESDPEVIELVKMYDFKVTRKQFEDAEDILKSLDRVVEGGSSRVAILRARLNRAKREAQ